MVAVGVGRVGALAEGRDASRQYTPLVVIWLTVQGRSATWIAMPSIAPPKPEQVPHGGQGGGDGTWGQHGRVRAYIECTGATCVPCRVWGGLTSRSDHYMYATYALAACVPCGGRARDLTGAANCHVGAASQRPSSWLY